MQTTINTIQLTAKQKSFFHKPRTMGEIMNVLFKGDAWEANNFQNNQINAGNLETCQYMNTICIKRTDKPIK